MARPRTTTVSDAGEDARRARQFVSALSRGLDVLGAFVPDGRPMGNQEIAARTGLPKPTVSRIAYTLTELGYLVYAPETEKYRLGPKVLSFAQAFSSGTRLADLAAGPLQALADATRGTVALGQADGAEMVYLAVHRSVSRIILRQDVGSRIPVAFTAMGHAWLDALPDAARAEALAALEPSLGARRRLFAETFARSRRQIAERGFCVVCGQWEPEINGAATALRFDGGGGIAVNIGGPAFWFREADLLGAIGAQLMLARERLVAAGVTRLLPT